jgi:hypothetical protein
MKLVLSKGNLVKAKARLAPQPAPHAMPAEPPAKQPARAASSQASAQPSRCGHAARRAQIKALIAKLAQRFPACFAVSKHCKRPLKIGIHRDIQAKLPELDVKRLSAALRFYTRGDMRITSSVWLPRCRVLT